MGTGWGDAGGIQRHCQNRALGATPPCPHQPDAMKKEKNESSISSQDPSLGAGQPVKALHEFWGRAFANRDHAGSTAGHQPVGRGK